MSPRGDREPILRAGFPRVSGDEPALFEKSLAEYAFSPRERG